MAVENLGTICCEENSALDGALEEIQAVDVCQICGDKIKNPKVLACLHVFSEDCLNKKLEESKAQDTSPTSPLAKEWFTQSIKCPICEQTTRLGDKGIAGLVSDSVLEDMMEADGNEKKQIGCTSCKAGDNAIARCRTCENLLCPNCCTAHEFMRCFEDHKVVTFEDMISSGEGIEHLRKPVFCSLHTNETVKFYCLTCMAPACQECITKSHSSSSCNIKQIPEAMSMKNEELEKFTAACKERLEECQKTSSNLNMAFEDLEMQKDNTKGLIEETFQSYKAVLEDARDTFLKELDELHEKRELALMDTTHRLSTYENKLSQAKSFVERVTKQGHAVQIAQLMQMMQTQLNTLCMGFVTPKIPANTEFKTDSLTFSNAVKSTFGFFAKQKDQLETDGLQPVRSFENGFTLPSMIPSMGTNNNNLIQSPSSQELVNIGNIRGNSMSLNLAQGIDSIPVGNVITSLNNVSVTQPQTGVASASGNNSPLSDSGISVDNVSHSSGGNAAMINAAAMAKLHQNQSPLFAPSMSIAGNITQGNAITSGSGDNSLASILGSNTPVSSSSNVQSANIEGLASLLNQPPPPAINTYNSIGSIDQFNASAQVAPELGSPNFNNEPYPPVRRSSKTNAMQISRFASGIGDTEIGHWGPQLKQVNEVPLRCKFGQLGPGKGQFNSPHGFCLGIDEDIVVADTNNHRIQVFQKGGEFKYQFGIPGREEGQLWYPRKVAVILKTGKFVVCDRGNERSRMQIFNRNGNFLRKIAIRYIDIVAGLAITPEGYIVAVDSVSPTVFCISETGDLMKWFDCSDFMREPSDIAINAYEYYVCDFKGHCVVVFSKEGSFLRRIGCENITNYPNGIDISGHGDVLIGDGHGNRFHVGVFQKDGSLISEFQCPYVKVSRCCGLKITSEGYIVTLAKNNHHVLVLNTLYIP